MQCHDVLQDQIVLSLCVCLRLISQVPLFHREHAQRECLQDSLCEGDGDVVGVVTPLRGVAQVVLRGVQVVEVGVRLRVHQDRGVEEDGEGQVEVEREEGEVKTQGHLEPIEVCMTRHQEKTETARSTCRAHRCQLARVVVCVLVLVDVVCVMIVVLIAHVDVVRAVYVQFS